MKRLLVVGASILQLPAIKKAKEMGLYVGVIDYDPQAIGIPYADEYFNVSTVDEAGVCEAARTFCADGIMTLATDMPMRAVAYACEQLGLIGIDYPTAIRSTDKGEMSRAFEKNGVDHPWYVVLENIEDMPISMLKNITFPCITKPIDNSGSRGVMLVRSMNELIEAIRYSSENSRGGRIIIQEYLNGPEVSVEVMVLDGVAHVLQITDKLTTGPPHFVEMGHSQPSQLPNDIQLRIRDLAEKATCAVGIMNGPAHVEIIVTDEGPKLVELGARMGGDCIASHLIPLSTGIDMVKATIDLAIGIRPKIERKTDMASAIKYVEAPIGRITKINDVELAQNIEGINEIRFVKSAGDVSKKINSSSDRVGFVIAQGETPQIAVMKCEKALDIVKISVENFQSETNLTLIC